MNAREADDHPVGVEDPLAFGDFGSGGATPPFPAYVATAAVRATMLATAVAAATRRTPGGIV